ncbi:MAG: glycerol-3-phosphate dehydrogenase [Chloroflexota bacterium]|nr:glycerol-3-phosphate dehydrogenase [Chloroflexota bacterium]
MQELRSVAVVNAGGWGTALAVQLANQGHDVRLWARRPELADQLVAGRENSEYLPGVAIPPNVRIEHDLAAALDGVDTVIVAVIASYMRAIAHELATVIPSDALLVHGTKGLEPESWRRLSEVLSEELSDRLTASIAVLCGPNHAEEVARSLPTAAVVACEDIDVAARLQRLLSTPWFRVYTNRDVAGVELCSAAKNVVAIAAGIGDGLGYGDNGKAALITRGLAEIWRLVEHKGGSLATVAGLAGLGDVVATCTSPHSRNRWAGEQLGRGRAPAEIIASTPMAIEGIPAARGIMAIARECGIEMPICEGVYRILFENQRPAAALQDLLARDFTSEG